MKHASGISLLDGITTSQWEWLIWSLVHEKIIDSLLKRVEGDPGFVSLYNRPKKVYY